MGKLLFARKLTAKEKKIFSNVLLKKKSNYLEKRVKIILLSGEKKYRIPEISKIVGIHQVNLRKWIHRFNLFGIDAIMEAPEVGLKKKFDKNFKKKLVEIVKQPPRTLGLFFSYWTLKNLKNYLENKRIVLEISHETIRRILREVKIDLKEMRKTIDLNSEF